MDRRDQNTPDTEATVSSPKAATNHSIASPLIGGRLPRPLYRALEDVLAFNATTMDLLFRMSKDDCCSEPDPDIGVLRNALRGLTNVALLLQLEDLGGAGASRLWTLIDTMAALQLPEVDRDPTYVLPTRVRIDSLLSAKSGIDSMFFASLPVLPIPNSMDPQDFAKIIDKVIELLKAWLEAAHQEGSASMFEIEREIQEIIDEWERMRETILASGYRIDIQWAFDLVKDALLKAINIFRQYGLSLTFVKAIWDKLWTFMAEIKGLLGGEAGSATVGFAIRMGLYALAFYIGSLIGKWIGMQKVDGKTINDWLADGIYYEYFAISDDCLDAEATYYAAAKERRDYENSGPTLDKSVMLALLSKEYAALFTLRETGVRKHCFDDVSVFDKVLARLKEKYRKLSGH